MHNETEVEKEDFIETVARRMRSGQIDPLTDNLEMEVFLKASLGRKVNTLRKDFVVLQLYWWLFSSTGEIWSNAW